MAQSLSQKLKIKENTSLLLINPPSGATQLFAPLPKGCKFIERSKHHEFIILFVKDQQEIKKYFPSALRLSGKGGLIWICYPKITSGIQTDLNRDKGWDYILKYDLTWKSMISLNETWTAFCMKNEPAPQKASRASETYHENVAQWSDPVKKTVKIPKDLDTAMTKGNVKKFFSQLGFTNKKEYVLWIVGAKQEKTRTERVSKAIEKMKKGLKNPTMK